MFPVTGSPKCVAFRSKHARKYLGSVHAGNEESRGGGRFFEELSDGADDVDVLASPYTRFYLEPSKEHDGLLHVRCCHNNKYWVAKHGGEGSGHWTIGIVNEPDDDLSKPSCTLFEPVPLTDGDNNLSIRFFRPQQTSSESDMTKEKGTTEEAYLHLGTGGHEKAVDQVKSLHDFSAIDLSKQLVLPKYVAFKGDNDMYLRARIIQKRNYLEFSSSDIADSTVVNTIFPNYANGNVRIKSNHFNRFWRLSPNWIWADSADSSSRDRDTLFRVVMLPDYIGLQNLGNSRYCKRLTADRKTSCLNASVDTITLEARLRVEEAVLSREIYGVEFKLSEARIYDEKPLTYPSMTSTNDTNELHAKTLTLKYEETQAKTWSSTVSLKIGVTAKLRAGIPVIAEGKVEVSTEFNSEYEWGSSIQTTASKEASYQAVVPPMTKVTIRAAVTQASVDVPFSYTQRDILTTGEVVTYKMDDGLFTGMNNYNFQFETTQEPI
ncbi:uncharacterized protein LOC119298435 [Triticum dicoccoides]|uniref:uncharacterized protein LOC119298435 n=1 Tax=Triticum dicoccoides TaxID=85692 RepID=UPI0018903BF4|nr:uncharacterized protein LOC119298435 [Triticum dicoccoides]